MYGLLIIFIQFLKQYFLDSFVNTASVLLFHSRIYRLISGITDHRTSSAVWMIYTITAIRQSFQTGCIDKHSTRRCAHQLIIVVIINISQTKVIGEKNLFEGKFWSTLFEITSLLFTGAIPETLDDSSDSVSNFFQ